MKRIWPEELHIGDWVRINFKLKGDCRWYYTVGKINHIGNNNQLDIEIVYSTRDKKGELECWICMSNRYLFKLTEDEKLVYLI